MTAAFHHCVRIGMWGKCFILIFHMCLGVCGFRLFKNRLSSLSVAESCGRDLKETLSISRSVEKLCLLVWYICVQDADCLVENGT